MVVKIQCNGRRITGVEVAADDVRRYFPRNVRVIELYLDHLQIQCGLRRDFWEGQPEICDPRLRVWLESKQFAGHPGEKPAPLALIPSGKNGFRVQAASGDRPEQSTPGDFTSAF